MTLPPEDAIRFVIRRAASLQHHLGAELGRRALVLPNARFFPDKFTGDAPSLESLVRRIQAHAGMSDVPIQTRIIGAVTPERPETRQAAGAAAAHHCKGDCGGKGCEGCDGSCHDRAQDGMDPTAAHDQACAKGSSSGCGSGCGTGCGDASELMGDEPRLRDLGDHWQVQVPVTELKQPLVLTTNLARLMGYVFLVETRSASHPQYDELDATAELASTLLGFGALLLNGAHIYTKSCGGPRIGRVTTLGCAELALATVLFAHRQQQELRPMLRELEATQKAAVEEAEQWFSERPKIIECFAKEPLRLERDEISMVPAATSVWSRWFGKRKPQLGASNDPDATLAELEAMLSQSPKSAMPQRTQRSDPHRDELRALVDEALADSGSQIQ